MGMRDGKTIGGSTGRNRRGTTGEGTMGVSRLGKGRRGPRGENSGDGDRLCLSSLMIKGLCLRSCGCRPRRLSGGFEAVRRLASVSVVVKPF